MEQIRKAYGEDVLVAFRHLPLDFHDQAVPAAKAAIAAQKQGKFWAYHDLLFSKQESLSATVYPELARSLGLDVAQFKSDMGSEDTAALLAADKILAHSVEITGTPTFLVNGRKMVGALPFSTFKVTIDSEISKINTRIGDGKAIHQARGEVSEYNILRNPRKDGGSGTINSLRRVSLQGAPFKGVGDPLVVIAVFSEFQ